jgi:hypothetical protein
MRVHPNPYGTQGTVESSDHGVSNLILLPRRNEEIEKMLMLERAAIRSQKTQEPYEMWSGSPRMTKSTTQDLSHPQGQY